MCERSPTDETRTLSTKWCCDGALLENAASESQGLLLRRDMLEEQFSVHGLEARPGPLGPQRSECASAGAICPPLYGLGVKHPGSAHK